MNVFTLKKISAGYPDKQVLHGVDLNICCGDFVSIIGPNGAGKSTLLKTLAGSLSPESGSIFFLERNLQAYSRRELAAERSVVEQFSSPALSFTVFDYIMLGRFPHQKFWDVQRKEDFEVVENALKVTDSEHLRERFITELSGGELQLVQIARAFSQNSSVIILDEPVSHLDINHSVQIMDLLYSLNSTGSTIVTVLHDINLASEYSSRMIGVMDGCLFFDGDPEDVVNVDTVSSLFGIRCAVEKSPLSGKPVVYPCPGHLR